MSKGLAFWILMLLWLVVWGVGSWGGPYYSHYGLYANGLLLFVLLGLLGWAVFGAAVR